jgi:hypothetical protein
MAFGADTQGGGLLDPPQVQGLGAYDWASMSGMTPASPLVGGNYGEPGSGGQRQVAVSQQVATLPAASSHPAAASWKELFNLKGNPVGWVCLASIAYLALSHLAHRDGKGRR